MELKHLYLKNGEQITIGVTQVSAVQITAKGKKLQITGPRNKNSATAHLSYKGLVFSDIPIGELDKIRFKEDLIVFFSGIVFGAIGAYWLLLLIIE